MSAIHALLLLPPDGPGDGAARTVPSLLGESEAEMLDRLRANDERAYARIYEVLFPRLVSVASDYVPSAVAEEIAQDVLALLWDRRATWPHARGIATYLYAAARNRARDAARHQGVIGRVAQGQIALHEPLGAAQHPEAPDTRLEHDELGRVFVREFQRLPDPLRSALLLRWVHQLGYPEIAEILGVTEATARKRVSRARESLVAVLEVYLT